MTDIIKKKVKQIRNLLFVFSKVPTWLGHLMFFVAMDTILHSNQSSLIKLMTGHIPPCDISVVCI